MVTHCSPLNSVGNFYHGKTYNHLLRKKNYVTLKGCPNTKRPLHSRLVSIASAFYVTPKHPVFHSHEQSVSR